MDLEDIQNAETDYVPEDDSSDDFDVNFYNSMNKETKGLLHDLKVTYRLCKRSIERYVRRKNDKRFINIVYLTTDGVIYTPNSVRLDSPLNFISEYRKQYPDGNISMLIPIFGLELGTKIGKEITLESAGNFYTSERTSISGEIFYANECWDFVLYKFKKDNTNIDVYGIYSPVFSYLTSINEFEKFENLVPFLRAARIVIRNFKKEGLDVDIVHSDKIPFFMGAEFEPKLPAGVKVIQTIDDFVKLDKLKQEPFWALINLADKKSMTGRIYKDKYMQKCISKLFNLPPKKFESQMSNCIDLIYKNYKIFNKTKENSDTTLDLGSRIFKYLNNRARKMYPNLIENEDGYYYPMLGSIKCADYWAIISKTYYKSVLEEYSAPKPIIRQLIKTADNSGYIIPGFGGKEFNKSRNNSLYNDFNLENFRKERVKNKKILLKEFSTDRLKTNFIDEKLFKGNDYKIYGYLDTFYESPLLFANPEPDIFGEGIDILFSSVLKLLELNKNIQTIISIKDGMSLSPVKAWVNFLEENQLFMGKWVFIDGEINFPRFFAGADMFLSPVRYNDISLKFAKGLKYGCVPVVSKSGLANDMTSDIFDNLTRGNSFKTTKSLLREDENTELFLNTILKALNVYNHNPSSFNLIVKNCLSSDLGWDFKKLERYHKIYQEIF